MVGDKVINIQQYKKIFFFSSFYFFIFFSPQKRGASFLVREFLTTFIGPDLKGGGENIFFKKCFFFPQTFFPHF